MARDEEDLHTARVHHHWLALHGEDAIEPQRPVVDPHHHLWHRPGFPYLLPEFLADLECGHRVTATVFLQCRAMHRADGPDAMKPVGETEFVNGIAAMSASGNYGPTRVAAGIVAHADLRLGDAVDAVLEAHQRAGGGRLRGIRHITVWDPDPAFHHPAYTSPPDLMAREEFRRGFARLASRELTFDAWIYHPQIPHLTDLAKAFPETGIVLDHLGGPLGARGYRGRRDEVFRDWKASMTSLAACHNVCVKLGGLGQRFTGLGFEERDRPPTSLELAAAMKPWVDTAIELFGVERCMFESNFPVDKGAYGYGVFWNACKRLAAGAGDDELDALLRGTATRFYRLGETV
jgi:predicted TIM-barrel fold metal-dependent hydrolase